jgi:hypothetical protein
MDFNPDLSREWIIAIMGVKLTRSDPVFKLVALYFSEIPCQGIFNEIGYNLIELNSWGLFRAAPY